MKNITRAAMVEAITTAGIYSVHPCNALDTAPTDENRIYYLDMYELQSIYAESIER